MLQKPSNPLTNGAGFMSSDMVIRGRGVAWIMLERWFKISGKMNIKIGLMCRKQSYWKVDRANRSPMFRLASFHHLKKKKAARQRTDDAYQRYAGCDPETESVADDALGYWNARILTQPDLARFALDMLGVPMSSAECERIFSSAKLLVTSSHNRLRPDIIETSECLRTWLDRSGEPSSKTEMGSQGPQRLQPKGKGLPRSSIDVPSASLSSLLRIPAISQSWG
jgi:hAT family C-terminal dimerisation region